MAANYQHLSSPNLTSFSSSVPYNHQRQPAIAMDKHVSPSLNCNKSSDESQMMSMVIKDRKHRRMISNRESAGRSRMRKQRQLEELCTHLLWLKNQNHELIDQLNGFLESQKQVIQDNHKLKKETLELRKLLSESQLATTYTGLGDIGFFRDLDDDEYDDHGYLPTTAHLRVQSSTVSSSNTNDSSALLH